MRLFLLMLTTATLPVVQIAACAVGNAARAVGATHFFELDETSAAEAAIVLNSGSAGADGNGLFSGAWEDAFVGVGGANQCGTAFTFSNKREDGSERGIIVQNMPLPIDTSFGMYYRRAVDELPLLKVGDAEYLFSFGDPSFLQPVGRERLSLRLSLQSLYAKVSGIQVQVAALEAVADGDWHHVAMTYKSDTATASVYVDGALAHAWVQVIPIELESFGLVIGGMGNGGTPPKAISTTRATIDAVGFFDRQLNELEVMAVATGDTSLLSSMAPPMSAVTSDDGGSSETSAAVTEPTQTSASTSVAFTTTKNATLASVSSSDTTLPVLAETDLNAGEVFGIVILCLALIGTVAVSLFCVLRRRRRRRQFRAAPNANAAVDDGGDASHQTHRSANRGVARRRIGSAASTLRHDKHAGDKNGDSNGSNSNNTSMRLMSSPPIAPPPPSSTSGTTRRAHRRSVSRHSADDEETKAPERRFNTLTSATVRRPQIKNQYQAVPQRPNRGAATMRAKRSGYEAVPDGSKRRRNGGSSSAATDADTVYAPSLIANPSGIAALPTPIINNTDILAALDDETLDGIDFRTLPSAASLIDADYQGLPSSAIEALQRSKRRAEGSAEVAEGQWQCECEQVNTSAVDECVACDKARP